MKFTFSGPDDPKIAGESSLLARTNSLTSSLDNETLKLITNPLPVLLYHSKWGNSSLFPGKIQIPSSSMETLVWSSPRELQKNVIDLQSLRSGKLLSGLEAHNFLNTCVLTSNKSSPEQIIVLAFREVLCVVFEEPDHCRRWNFALAKIMKGIAIEQQFLEPKEVSFRNSRDFSYTEQQYGAVFDISDPGEANEFWKEIKITFVKEETSHTVYLNYDKSQSDLYDSINETLESVDSCLDVTNLNVVKNYLLDVTRLEYMERLSLMPVFVKIKPLVPLKLKFKRKENTELRNKYKELNGTEIGSQLIQLMKRYESQDLGDSLADALNLVYMQKLVNCLLIHQVACEHAIVSMRKSLEVKSSLDEEVKQPVRKSDNSADVEKRINKIMNTKKEEPSTKKSSFREACECIII